MDKEKLATYAVIAVGLVLGGRYVANLLFAWFDTLLLRKKEQNYRTLDELIDAKTRQLGGRPKVAEVERPLLSGGAPAPQLEEKTGPEEEQRKLTLHRIYDLETKRGQQESEEAYYLRIMNMKQLEKPEILKRAYKLRSKEFHPDRFNLDLFDAKTKKRLAARVHENYLLVQTAYAYLKKKA
jgi:hypothetical protein